jgi:hypothetical protein
MFRTIEFNSRFIYRIAVLVSVLFSLIAAVKTTVINPDGICYLQSAALMPTSFAQAVHLCGQAHWPFYSYLIYLGHALTNLSYYWVAYLLDGIFSLITVCGFIAIIRSQTLSLRISSLAALVILASHEFNTVHTEIIRDHGYWAFYILSIYCLIKFLRSYQWRTAWLWSISLIIATLFRIEGAVFLLMMPWLILFDTTHNLRKRWSGLFQLHSLTILLAVILINIVLLSPHHEIALGRLTELFQQIGHGCQMIYSQFMINKIALTHDVLNSYSAADASLLLFIMLISWYVISVVVNTSYVYSVLILYSALKKLVDWPCAMQITLWGYIGVNIIITASYLAEHLFLSKRYLQGLSLVLMLWVPYALAALIKQWPQRKWPVVIAFLLILMGWISGVYEFGPSKTYLRDAGVWLETQTKPQAKIYSNDYQVMYYSGHFAQTLFKDGPAMLDKKTLTRRDLDSYEYLAIRLNHNEIKSGVLPFYQQNMTPVKVFKNKRNDQVRIYWLYN